ncbi:MAG: hypothetical protein KDB07_04055 [Planctomycetes bacterium]|nr:hypothetical protein [Planctomycetota bacterium]
MSEFVRLSPLRDEVELEVAINALRGGYPVVMPDSVGLILALSAEVADSEATLAQMSGGEVMLLLPGVERFDRVFRKVSDPLRDWFLEPARVQGWALRAPHPNFPKGLVFRFAEGGTVSQRIIEAAKVPTYATRIREVKGNAVSARTLMARWGTEVACYLEDPFQKDTKALRHAVLLPSGIAIDGERVPALAPMHVHFVCLGNLNRSAFAEAYLRERLRRDQARAEVAGLHFLPAYRVTSSGLIAREDTEAPDKMVAASRAFWAEEWMLAHRPQRFALELVTSADYIVPMAQDIRSQLEAYGLQGRMPSFGREGEIDDPMGKSLDDYVATASAVEVMLKRHVLSRGCPLEGLDHENRHRL